MKIFFTIAICLLSLSTIAQDVKIIPVDFNTTQTSMRGLSAVDSNVVWVSGIKGVVMRRIDSTRWNIHEDEHWSHLDFRDIHAFSDKEAIIMSSGDGCDMYKTIDGGKKWTLVFKNYMKGVFFNGMDFWDNQSGIAFSDPIDGKFFIIHTTNGGKSWNIIKDIQIPKNLENEAGFAASGTGITCVGDSTVYIGTGGGAVSRVFVSHNRGKNWTVVDTPMKKGEASGIYSLVFVDEKNGVAVGGSYKDSTITEGNCVITTDGGLTWEPSKNAPQGYKSCVAVSSKGVLVACGRMGVDVSYDKGLTWKHVSDEAYYSCVLNTPTGGWLTGRDGKMAQLVFVD
ncbi:MAG: hypothetical protein J5I47_08085 [Vicingus serpentipes]|nr:hypothetical protein [Vicingus serpentipes]